MSEEQGKHRMATLRLAGWEFNAIQDLVKAQIKLHTENLVNLNSQLALGEDVNPAELEYEEGEFDLHRLLLDHLIERWARVGCGHNADASVFPGHPDDAPDSP